MNNKTKIIFFISLFLVSLVLLNIGRKTSEQAVVCFSDSSDSCIDVEVADTLSERANGLMFRQTLGKNEGMLFVFEKEDRHSFWMKNTLIPIKIIWLDKDFKIVYIEDAFPCYEEPCEIYVPTEKAKYVLEINQEFLAEEIEVGEIVKFKNN